MYGLTDALSLRLTGAYSRHDLPAGDKGVPGGALTAFHAGVGVSYAIDIVRLVPYFDLSVGLLGMTAPPLGPGKPAFASSSGCATPDVSTLLCFGVEIGLGVDYLLTRRVALGVVVRYHAFVSNLNDIPIYLYAGPRVAIHFGG